MKRVTEQILIFNHFSHIRSEYDNGRFVTRSSSCACKNLNLDCETCSLGNFLNPDKNPRVENCDSWIDSSWTGTMCRFISETFWNDWESWSEYEN